MRVWIDQDLCTGDGLCVDHCPDVFELLEDGIAYVRDRGIAQNDPGGAGSVVDVPKKNVDEVIRAAEVCPGECIFLEVDLVTDADLDAEVHPVVLQRTEIIDEPADATPTTQV